MKGHPIAAAIVAFLVVPAVGQMVLPVTEVKPPLVTPQINPRNAGILSGLGLAAAIAAYYYCK